MRKNLITAVVIAVAVIAIGGINNVVAQPKAGAQGIAVVSIPQIMKDSLRAQALQTQVLQSRDTGIQELKQMEAKLQVVQADIEARKPGSAEYSKLKQDYMQKSATIKAQQEFLQQELMLKNQRAMETLYKEVLAAVNSVAKSQGYELVLDRDEVELPANSPSELSLAIQTHKVLYSVDYLDITTSVIDALDDK
jgi:outer membrane protein